MFLAKKRCLIALESHQTSYLKWVWSLFLAWLYLLPIREVQPQMVDIPTIVSMRTIAVFVNIVRLFLLRGLRLTFVILDNPFSRFPA